MFKCWPLDFIRDYHESLTHPCRRAAPPDCSVVVLQSRSPCWHSAATGPNRDPPWPPTPSDSRRCSRVGYRTQSYQAGSGSNVGSCPAAGSAAPALDGRPRRRRHTRRPRWKYLVAGQGQSRPRGCVRCPRSGVPWAGASAWATSGRIGLRRCSR